MAKMNGFIKKTLLFLSPILLLLGSYLILDPFKVIYSYNRYYEDKAPATVMLNQDYVSTSTFERYYPSQRFNSFIFGSSRSIFYQVSDWEKHLAPDASCYHFDATGESLAAIVKKTEYLDQKNVNIKNVLLILDYETLIQDKTGSSHLTIISPQLVHYTNAIRFHCTFLKSFFTQRFFIAFLDLKLSGRVKPYMKKGNLIDDRPRNYDPLCNEIRFDYFEDLIEKGAYYTPERLAVFYTRDTVQQYSEPSIHDKQKLLLSSMNRIFQKNGTDLKVIISPLYDQKKLNPADVLYLKKLFGNDHVFDYSGINSITQDYRNYYESSHYRPIIARQLMNEIYRENGKHIFQGSNHISN